MDVKVVEVNHCAFVDFAEETAAARVVEFILMYRYHTLVCLFKMWKQMAQI